MNRPYDEQGAAPAHAAEICQCGLCHLARCDQVAASVNTNPVIIRRSLGDLRRAGLVRIRHGAGQGWSLARAPEDIMLFEVYDAVEREPLFGMRDVLIDLFERQFVEPQEEAGMAVIGQFRDLDDPLSPRQTIR